MTIVTSLYHGNYLATLKIYAKTHRRKLADGRVVPWIDENVDPFTGVWIARKRCGEQNAQLKEKGQADRILLERGKDYDHSSFCDLIVSGLAGLRPRADDTLEVNPLTPDAWDWFCLDNVSYHGRTVTVVWDRTGEHYGRGKGLSVFADGKRIAHSAALGKVSGALP